MRELKAVGGNLKALRIALTGKERGPELWAVIAALPRDEALRRILLGYTSKLVEKPLQLVEFRAHRGVRSLGRNRTLRQGSRSTLR